MCGIAGIYKFSNSRIDLQNEINVLTDAVAHRGPNGRGVWLNQKKDFALGHRRLSILDISSKGDQPMSYDNGRYWIVLNGEIYNFLEIREELIQAGYSFQSETDTEVILAAYKHWGESMQHKFNGMWALAIFDIVKDTLFLSRDRFGVKPLYYFYQERIRFYFSSEVRAIHTLLEKTHPLNNAVITDLVNGGFKSHGTIQTYLKSVFALPGGYSLLVKDGKMNLQKWYELKKIEVPTLFEDQVKRLRELTEDACKIRMRSDVPVATCLSGGIDSGSITAVLSKFKLNGNSRFNHYTHKGYCAAFPGTPIDESNEAIRLAHNLNSGIDVLPVHPPTADELIAAMRDCDGPMHSLAFYPIWKLYKHIKENGITVTLDGQGPDEMLGGYRPLREAMATAVELKDILWLRDVYKVYADMGETDQFSSKKFARNELNKFYKSWYIKGKQSLKKIFKRIINSKADIIQAVKENELNPVRLPDVDENPLNRSLFSQFFQNPLPGILQQYDRCSMANAVECRMPFMDYRIVEFIFSLPVKSKVGGGYTKRILREAMKDILPDETRLNKRKIGFNAPIVDWFRGGLKEFMLEQMSLEVFLNSGHFDGKKLKQEFEKFLLNENPGWDEAWKFWPPVHFTWWYTNNCNTALIK